MTQPFYLYRDHQNFNAYTDRVNFGVVYRNSRFSPGCALLEFCAIFGCQLLLIRSIFSRIWQGPAFEVILIIAVSVVFSAAIAISQPLPAYFRYRQLVREGVTLDGEITGGTYHESRGVIQVTYTFISPTFESIHTTQHVQAGWLPIHHQDYIVKAMTPGTPIRILYAHPRNFVAL